MSIYSFLFGGHKCRPWKVLFSLDSDESRDDLFQYRVKTELNLVCIHFLHTDISDN